MPLLDQFGEELQEERYDKQPDVHAIDIGIRCHYHLIISKGVETVLNVESSLQKVEFLILIHHLLGQAK